LQPPFHEKADGVSKISFIPEWISELKDLEVLDLSGNQIQHISEAVSKLHKLKKLYLDDNGTVVIDPSLSRLTALEVLWLQKSRLSNLKKIVYQLPNLKEFYLSQLDECKYGPIMSNPRGIEFVGEDELTLLQIRPQTSEKCESFTHSLGCMLTMLKVW
jgi:Leucine-rich repeat (LRR) protein